MCKVTPFPAHQFIISSPVESSSIDPKPRKFQKEGYLDRRTLPLDPWDNDYVYLIPGSNGETYEIISYGHDGEPGGLEVDSDISTANL